MAELTGSKQTNPSGASFQASSHQGSSSAKPELTENIKEAYATVQKKTQEAITTSEDFIRQRPIRTVLGAAAVGFLAGFLTRKRH